MGGLSYVCTGIIDYDPDPDSNCWHCENVPVGPFYKDAVFFGVLTLVLIAFCIRNIVKIIKNKR